MTGKIVAAQAATNNENLVALTIKLDDGHTVTTTIPAETAKGYGIGARVSLVLKRARKARGKRKDRNQAATEAMPADAPEDLPRFETLRKASESHA